MVLPMVDQHKPKCYLCNKTLDDTERLREHQQTEHKEFFEFHKEQRSPAPGDVTVF